MEMTIERDSFNAAIVAAKRVVEKRNTIPILSNVLINVEAGEVRVTATDLDRVTTIRLPCDMLEAGAVTVPGYALADLLKGFPKGGQIKLKAEPEPEPVAAPAAEADGEDAEDSPVARPHYRAESNPVTITGGHAKVNLHSLPVADFPAIGADAAFTHIFEIPAADLRRLLAKTAFAISTEETRYYLNGVFLHAPVECGETTKLRAVATDGHRMARVDVALPNGAADMPGVILPTASVLELQKLLAKHKDMVQVCLCQQWAEFTVDNVTVLTKLIDETFPDYQRVIPAQNDKRVTVDKDSFAAVIKRVSAMSSERGRAVKIEVSGDVGMVTVKNPDLGDVSEAFDCQSAIDGIEIGFNAKYLLDCLEQVDGDTAEIVMSDPGAPALVGERAVSYMSPMLSILMPIRI